MRIVRLQAICLTCLGMIAILASCGRQVKRSDGLFSEDGLATGVVVEYKTAIDKKSVSKESFQVPGRQIATVFVSDSNPIKKDPGIEKNVSAGGGRYVVVLLSPNASFKDSDEPIQLSLGKAPARTEIRIKQVSPIRTVSGKELKPWDKAMKTGDMYVINGGPAR